MPSKKDPGVIRAPLFRLGSKYRAEGGASDQQCQDSRNPVRYTYVCRICPVRRHEWGLTRMRNSGTPWRKWFCRSPVSKNNDTSCYESLGKTIHMLHNLFVISRLLRTSIRLRFQE